MTWFFKDRLDDAMGNCYLSNFTRGQFVQRIEFLGGRDIQIIEHPTNPKLFALSCMHPTDDTQVLLEGWFQQNVIPA